MRDATDVFSEWAGKGKDEGMERGHAASVEEMLDLALETNNLSQRPFTAIDIGCGNGDFAKKISNKVGQVYCLDTSQEFINLCKINVSNKNNIKILLVRLI